jgi:hypothetical protein
MTRTLRSTSLAARVGRSGIARTIRRRFAPRDRWLATPYKGRLPRPEGWTVGPPDFVGVGVQKAGTSWWFEAICQHPKVQWVGDRPKELHFFDRFWRVPFSHEDASAYHELFPRPAGRLIGEWTPRYMADYWTPRLLAAAAPDARLLVMLRDPVERYISGLTHVISRGAPLDPIIAADAFGRGLYALQLDRLTRYFDRSQILVLQYERSTVQAASELARTFDFLGLEALRPVPDVVRTRVNPTASPKPTLNRDARQALVDAYWNDVHDLVRMDISLDLSLWPNFASLAS